MYSRKFIPSPLKRFNIEYSVAGGPSLTFHTKAYSDEEAQIKMQEAFKSGDMLNAPAWHEVAIHGIRMAYNESIPSAPTAGRGFKRSRNRWN